MQLQTTEPSHQLLRDATSANLLTPLSRLQHTAHSTLTKEERSNFIEPIQELPEGEDTQNIVVPMEAEPIEEYKKNWFEILKARQPIRTLSPDTPPPKKKGRRKPRRKVEPQRETSPVFDSPPAVAESGSAPQQTVVSPVFDSPSHRTPTVQQREVSPVFDSPPPRTAPPTTETPPARNVTEIILKKFEEHVKKKSEGGELPKWWGKRDKLMRGVAQRVQDVSEGKVYKVCNPNDLKVSFNFNLMWM